MTAIYDDEVFILATSNLLTEAQKYLLNVVRAVDNWST